MPFGAGLDPAAPAMPAMPTGMASAASPFGAGPSGVSTVGAGMGGLGDFAQQMMMAQNPLMGALMSEGGPLANLPTPVKVMLASPVKIQAGNSQFQMGGGGNAVGQAVLFDQIMKRMNTGPQGLPTDDKGTGLQINEEPTTNMIPRRIPSESLGGFDTSPGGPMAALERIRKIPQRQVPTVAQGPGASSSALSIPTPQVPSMMRLRDMPLGTPRLPSW